MATYFQLSMKVSSPLDIFSPFFVIQYDASYPHNWVDLIMHNSIAGHTAQHIKNDDSVLDFLFVNELVTMVNQPKHAFKQDL